MRFSTFATMLAALPATLGWQISMYRERDCNSRNDANFDYYVISGEGRMDFCSGLADDRWPPQVRLCEYFWNGGRDGPAPCVGQIQTANSFRVTRGKVKFWRAYDQHPAQPLNMRCSLHLTPDSSGVGFRDTENENGQAVFYPENGRCRNAYYTQFGNWGDNTQHWRPIQGLEARDA